ncbi:NBAS subunit of NRZ tethering complex-like [Choristoneura fumiferana]|uniref:NBAS subunit of NRZ tethering complex-like n=1 Tax=Choristoneura fumiferana TaxID=7141 RepID=UPI003D15EA43
MEENKSILHELYVFSEWKPEPEYIQKPDNILPENISALWRWLKFFGPKKSLIDSIAACKERQQKWHIALGDEGKVIAVLTDNILEIRTKRSEYATIAARTTGEIP